VRAISRRSRPNRWARHSPRLTISGAIPAAVLVPVGGFLLAYAAGLWLLGSRPRPSHPAVRVVVAGNLLWVAASVVAVVAGWWSPTGAGTAFLLLQAAAVAVFAELEVTGLRRARSAAA